MLDFIRIACAVPEVKPGDVKKNAADICAFLEKADEQNVDVLLFPELALTGYTCGDLFCQDTLWRAVKAGIWEIAAASGKLPNLTAVVGLPLRIGPRLFDCAAVFARGEVCGIVPKSHLSAGEGRWFSSGEAMELTWLKPGDIGLQQSQDYYTVPVGADQLFRLGDDAMVGIEICSDLMGPQPRAGILAANGAEIILNPAASANVAGKQSRRRELVKHTSDVCACVYAYASAGCTESTADVVYSGHSIIAENGKLLKENGHLIDGGYMLVQDCDLGRVRSLRAKARSFDITPDRWLITEPYGDALRSDGSLYPLQKLPFVPSSKSERDAWCMEVFQIQVAGLKQRLKTINTNAVIGISGGLDSTLALLVCVEAMRQLGRPLTDIYGVTMPCFGTSDRTYTNAWDLMRRLGISSKEISIKNAVTLHFDDIGHDKDIHNGTYENSQARERTQILMDYASVVNAIVVGTGDLSELALGWCTYNGDHMSMYGVNGSVPKTLIRWMIEAIAQDPNFAPAKDVLADILDTPISPELLPPDAQGKIAQQTEDLVGPYALHDFFLYHMLNFGFGPEKIYTLACRAFKEDFEPVVIKKWLRTFCWRFFSQQFKRNCMPDGAKALAISFSPRGDWAMPSDATARIWLEEVDAL